MDLSFSDDTLMERFCVSRESIEKLRIYEALLYKWQKAINIVSQKSLADAWIRHFVDSVQLLPLLPEGPMKILDLGSGGGFPGLVIAILRPDCEITLLDSDQRKMQFLQTVSRETGTACQFAPMRLDNYCVKVLEEGALPDCITARGFSALPNILDWTQALNEQKPLRYVLLKGGAAEGEVESARKGFDFSCVSRESITDEHAAILQISDVCKL